MLRFAPCALQGAPHLNGVLSSSCGPRFDRWVLVTIPVLWSVLLILKSYGLTEYGSWGNVVGGVMAMTVGALAVVQMLRQRRERDSATELHLNTRETS